MNYLTDCTVLRCYRISTSERVIIKLGWQRRILTKRHSELMKDYEFFLMPFRLTNVSDTFMGLMNCIFKPQLRKFVLVFFDDILVYSSGIQQHIEHLQVVLNLLRKHSLITKRSKCSFRGSRVGEFGSHCFERE